MVSAKSPYSYYIEAKAKEIADRPKRFLEAFAAVLEHSSYALALNHYVRLSTKCARCASSCQLYEATGEQRDIPCQRSELLFRVYRRYFTPGGQFRARKLGANLLMNIGPRKDGSIHPDDEKALREVGRRLRAEGSPAK